MSDSWDSRALTPQNILLFPDNFFFVWWPGDIWRVDNFLLRLMTRRHLTCRQLQNGICLTHVCLVQSFPGGVQFLEHFLVIHARLFRHIHFQFDIYTSANFWRHSLAPLTTLCQTSTKKKMDLGKTKVLQFYLGFLSTTLLELSWVDYYAPRCTQLNSKLTPVVLNSTQSNQVGSCWMNNQPNCLCITSRPTQYD